MLATLAYSLVAQPIAVPRFLIIVVPGIVLLVAFGVVNLPRRWLRVVAMVALLATSLYTVSGWYRAPSKEDWKAATSTVLADLQPNDAVIVEPRTGTAVAHYYARHLGDTDLPIVTDLDFDGPAVGDRLWEMRRGDEVSGWLADNGLEEWRVPALRAHPYRRVPGRHRAAVRPPGSERLKAVSSWARALSRAKNSVGSSPPGARRRRSPARPCDRRTRRRPSPRAARAPRRRPRC